MDIILFDLQITDVIYDAESTYNLTSVRVLFRFYSCCIMRVNGDITTPNNHDTIVITVSQTNTDN